MEYKKYANGTCGICEGEVPSTNNNLFYCSESCRIKAWKLHNPEEIEPDWNALPTVLYY